MKKKILIPLIVIGALLIGSVVYLAMSLNKQKQANQAMQELAEIDKKEMENWQTVCEYRPWMYSRNSIRKRTFRT